MGEKSHPSQVQQQIPNMLSIVSANMVFVVYGVVMLALCFVRYVCFACLIEWAQMLFEMVQENVHLVDFLYYVM